jgi:hypothetical protein
MAKYVIFLPVGRTEKIVVILDSKMVNKDRCFIMTPLESPYGKTYGLTKNCVSMWTSLWEKVPNLVAILDLCKLGMFYLFSFHS